MVEGINFSHKACFILSYSYKQFFFFDFLDNPAVWTFSSEVAFKSLKSSFTDNLLGQNFFQ